jgi:hypothetical protein
MKIDTEIRRITKPGANLFLALGFSPKKRNGLQAVSRSHAGGRLRGARNGDLVCGRC